MKEVLENNEKLTKVNIEYQRPRFWRRVFANLLDFLIMAALTVLFFIPTRSIVVNSNKYKSLENTIQKYQAESFLYEKNEEGKYVDIVTYLDTTLDFYSSLEKKEFFINRIDSFIDYISINISSEIGNEIQKEYDNWRLSQQINGHNYFEKINNVIVQNTTYEIYDETFVKNIYVPYIDNYLIGHFQHDIPQVKNALTVESNFLLFLEIPVSFSLAVILTYIIPPFLFKRNRFTIGRLSYKIGLVDSNLLAVSTKRLIIKSLFFFFLEALLSLFTVGIPMIITFTMTIFTKKNQGFADFMCDIQEIDLNTGKIYYSKEEALVSSLKNNKKPVNFNSNF